MDEMNFFTATPAESLQAFNFSTTTEASTVSTQQWQIRMIKISTRKSKYKDIIKLRK